MKKKLFLGFLAFTLLLTAGCANSRAEAADEAVAAGEDPMDGVAAAVDPAGDKAPFEIRDNMIFNENVPVVVDFYADWCGPCKQYAPVFHAVADKYAEAACFVSLNADEYPDLCKTYGISSIPTTLFLLPGGEPMGKETGVLTESTLEMYVNQLVATSAGVDMEL